MKFKHTARCWGFRFLATAVAGAGGSLLFDQVAVHGWQFQPELWMLALSAIVPAVVTLVATKSMAIFTDSCMCVPTGASGLKEKEPSGRQSSGSSGSSGPVGARAGKAAALNVVARANQKPGQAAEKKSEQQNAVEEIAYEVISQNDKVTVKASVVQNGYAHVAVIAAGFSRAQLKGSDGFLSKLHGIAGVTWASHKNIGGHRKEIVGKVAADKLESVVAQLKELSEKYSK